MVFVTTFLTGLLILALKGLYPFGARTIDCVDLSALLSSYYAHFADVFHGEKAFFFDWYTALGVNMSFASSGGSFFSIFQLFFCFVNRNKILESFSWYFLMMTSWMSVSMYIYVHRRFSLKLWTEAVVSVGYGLCGFVLMSYTMISWLDLAFWVPLIFYFAGEVLKKGKEAGFVATLTLAILCNFYLSAMVLFFLLLEAGWHLALCGKRSGADESDRTHVAAFAGSVLLSLFLSAVNLVPQLIQTLGSSRFANGSSGSVLDSYLKILSSSGGYTTRWWVLLGISFPAAYVAAGLWKDLRDDRRRFLLVTGSILFVCLPLVFENVALLWHLGSYDQYPMRFGFLVYLVFASAMCNYAKERQPEEGTIRFLFAALTAMVSVCLLLYGKRWYETHPGLTVSFILHLTLVCIAGTFPVYLGLLLFKKGRYLRYAMFLWICEILFYGILTIGQPTYITGFSEEPEHEGESVRICAQLSDAWKLEPERIARVKNPDESLNVNYPFFLRQPALSNLTHLLPPSVQPNVIRLGYSIHFTRLLDSGGTAFSDALLNVKQVISCVKQDPALYSLTKETEVVSDHLTGERATYGLYDCVYTIPFGALTVRSDDVTAILNAKDIVSRYNALFDAFSGGTEDVFAAFTGCSLEEPCRWNEEITVELSGKKLLYLVGNCPDREDGDLEIVVNGEPVSVPSIREVNNTKYPAHFNNGAVFLGQFEDEMVSVLLREEETPEIPYDTYLFTLDAEMLEELCDNVRDRGAVYTAGTHSLHMQRQGNAGEYLLIPVRFDEGWSCRVNGKKAELTGLMDVFTLIPLEDGNNEIKMTWWPQGFFAGLLLTLLALFAAVLVGIKKIAMPACLEKPVKCVILAVFYLAVIFVFVIPMGYTMIQMIRGLI